MPFVLAGSSYLSLDDALVQLSRRDAQQGRIVELRFFYRCGSWQNTWWTFRGFARIKRRSPSEAGLYKTAPEIIAPM
jgi:hypothetical protein